MMLEEHGMSREMSSRPLMHGFATFIGFAIFGGIPLLPYVLGFTAGNNFVTAITFGFLALFLVGATRSYVTRERMVRGVVEILAIGVVTAAIAYGVGIALRGVTAGVF